MQASSPKTEIALVGMACRLPGADHLNGYWRLIREGISTSQPVPDTRLDRSLYFDPRRGVPNRTYSDVGCLVNYSARGSQFDRLPQAVRECPDVAYRTLCDVAAEACFDAGLELHPTRLRAGGVYLGHARSSGLAGDLAYGTCVAQSARLLHQVEPFRQSNVQHDRIIDELVQQVRQEYPHRDRRGGPRLGPYSAASLLAETFAMDGPCMAFNSACASSLSALYQAVLALQQGQIDVAMVGGASYFHFDTLVMFSQAQSLSSVMSRPFDRDADGLVVGEGFAMVILKTLDLAIRDGDTIHAVIRGIGVSSDGKGKSLWAPRKEGQIVAIQRAYNEHLQPSDLQYVEAHATSTQVGDATELAALYEAMRLPADRKIPIGSVKANVGHTLETAGLCGLLKTVLCMRHGAIPPAVNLTHLNDTMDWDSLPFYVPTREQPWPEPAAGRPRCAAVNAFGIGGLNVHVVLEEVVPTGSRAAAPTNGSPRKHKGVDDAIAVVGRGVILPGALNVEAFAELLSTGGDPKGPIHEHRIDSERYLETSQPQTWHCTNNLAGAVRNFEYDWRSHKIPPKQIAQASPLQFMILDAVEQAFREAGMDPESVDRSRIGVVVGTSFGGEFSTQLLQGLRLPEFRRRLLPVLARAGIDKATCTAISDEYAQVFAREYPAILDETGSFTSSSLASRITKSFDLMGGGVAVDAGHCSSSAALLCCLDQLRSRNCDVMICVGGQEDLGPSFLERMSLAGTLAAGNPKSPFDEDAAGTVPGEGCVAVLLMRHEDAQQQGRDSLAVIRGTGVAAGSNQRTATQQAIHRAFASQPECRAPAITPRDVARIETTSAGSTAFVAEELDGLSSGYTAATRQRPVSLDCLMTQTGHLGATSALAALVKSSMELQRGTTTGTFGLSKPSAILASHAQLEATSHARPFQAASDAGRWVTAIHNAERQTAYHILIERGAKVHAPQQNNPSKRSTASYSVSMVEGIPVVDATLRRKQAMRDKANRRSLGDAPEVPDPPAPVSAVPPAQPRPSLDNGTPAATADVMDTSLAAQPQERLSKSELASFLTNFVVEQTGYPPEFVEMDADLEADLGIDSIKKAQMFGELGEHFSVTPDANLTLDDFPTLQHVLDFLAESSSVSDTSATASSTASAIAPVSPSTPTSAAPPSPTASSNSVPFDRTPDAQLSSDSYTNATAPASSHTTPPASNGNGSNPHPAGAEQAFLAYISEQTGYPLGSLDFATTLGHDLGLPAQNQQELIQGLRDAMGVTGNGATFAQCETLGDLFAAVQTPMQREQSDVLHNPPRDTHRDAEAPSDAALIAPEPTSKSRSHDLIPEYNRLRRTLDLLDMVGLSVPYFAEHETVTGDTTKVQGREVIIFGSTNYLGMSGDPVVAAGATDAIAKYGTSVSASRLIAGKPLHRELEQELAAFLGAEATLAFSSGYAANESTIGHLFGPGDLIIHDALAHNCIIQGAILSGAQRLNFPHNDCDALEQQLQQIRSKYRRTLIAIEGAYSMDGDFPDVPRILEIKRRYDAFLLVDDAHAIGTMGATGRGTPEFFRIDPREIDLWVGTLSKALGSGGGFVAGSRELIEYLKHSTPGFIYTDALPPASAGAALAALRLLQREPERVARLQDNARLLLDLAKQHGLDTRSAGQTPIVPIMVGNSHTALLLSRRLLDRGIDIQPIVYPAVQNDASRLRFMVTAQHSHDQIRFAIDSLAKDLKEVEAEAVPISEWKAALQADTPLDAATEKPRPAASDASAKSSDNGRESSPQNLGSSHSSIPQPTAAPPAPAPPTAPPQTAPEPSILSTASKTLSGDGSQHSAPPPMVAPSTWATTSATDTLITAPQPDANHRESEWTRADLQAYLINFIVEQTGYPPEFVEMDADLEADLGIDSIKKAQLFGELGQHFDIEPDETLTLDDFPALQEVFDYIADQVGIAS